MYFTPARLYIYASTFFFTVKFKDTFSGILRRNDGSG
jgi:hypothetical protein